MPIGLSWEEIQAESQRYLMEEGYPRFAAMLESVWKEVKVQELIKCRPLNGKELADIFAMKSQRCQ